MLPHLNNLRSHLLRPSCIPPNLAHYSSSALEWLASFTNFEQKGVPAAAGTDTDEGFDLARMHSLLDSLDSPHTSLSSVFHVAGTKGKGSTVAMLSSILKSSGYTVGSYTSPHVISLHERISINGGAIPAPALDALIDTWRGVVEAQQAKHGGRLTHFEILTALALKHFQQQGVEVAVIETGLGGVRDATNVFGAENLVAAVITALGNDHAAALGGSMQSIAAAKAGIMKPGRPVIIAPQTYPEAEAVLLEHAERLGCPVINVTDQVRFSPLRCLPETEIEKANASGGFKYRQGAVLEYLSPFVAEAFLGFDNKGSVDSASSSEAKEVRLGLRLIGEHQLQNAATALTAAAIGKQKHQQEKEKEGEKRNRDLSVISLSSAVQGLEAAFLPGRFQICTFTDEGSNTTTTTAEESQNERSTTSPLVVLDGAHTAESAAALVKTFQSCFSIETPVALVLAMADDKSHTDVCLQLRKLKPAVAVFTQVAVAGGNARAAAPGALAGAWQAAAMREVSEGGQRVRGRRTRELIQASLVAAVAKAKMELRAHTTTANGSLGRSTMDGGINNDASSSKESQREVESVGNTVMAPGGVILVCGSLHAVAAALQNLDLTPV